MRKDIAVIVGAITAATLLVVAAFSYRACGHAVFCERFFVDGSVFSEFYAKNLRGSLFAGFLTLGGFLMSLKTFIVVNMKKEVFDKPEYEKLWLSAKANNPHTAGMRYGPLRYLASTIFIAIVCCISTATAQLTLGLFPCFWTAVICLWAAAVAIGVIIRSLLLIRENLNRMFEFLDEEQRG